MFSSKGSIVKRQFTLLGLAASVALSTTLANAVDADTYGNFCMRHIEGRQILHECAWNQGAIQTATCVEVGKDGETTVKLLKSIEMANWELVQIGEPGCQDPAQGRPERIRGEEDGNHPPKVTDQ